MSQEYDSVVSIGSWCCVAQQLRGRDLRKLSYPFDWIFGNLEIVRRSVNEPFTVLKEFRGKLGTDFECAPYSVISFPHHSPTSAKDVLRLRNACRRWKALLASQQRVLLVHTPRPNQSVDSVCEKIRQLLRDIREKNDKLDVSALVLCHRPWSTSKVCVDDSTNGRKSDELAPPSVKNEQPLHNFVEKILSTDDMDVFTAHVSHEWDGDNWDGRDHGALWEEIFEHIKLKSTEK